ncbi:sister chromatid cohesion protein PDS5 homolog C-like isoform X1 [Mercurialis annua]|uniref:sister chromatid cohesion protein PDS5 homolog C-like isoform X1 n=1 Tax=Mercurialis annua TaxID=3986 RepID=UPI00215ED110|nr:sister chromatid cohesion protein PDS5 homolog C-like isoform X1 [Mercurialis annua]
MAGKELEKRLIEDGKNLLNPPFCIDHLLSILDRVECDLSKVDQSPHGSMAASLSLLKILLVSDKLLRHSDTDVKVSVAACISQIIRITAPDAPYDATKMKEIFYLIVATFPKLSHMSSSFYSKAVSVLVTLASTRAVVMMMDLHCHALISQMFQLFLLITRSNDSDAVSAAMASIMTITILESDDISLEIFSPLLISVRKENRIVAPTSWKLGKKVIKNCGAKIEPYILKTVEILEDSLDKHDQNIRAMCQKATNTVEPFHICCSEEDLINDERPTTPCLDGKRTRRQITSPNAELGETTDKINDDRPTTPCKDGKKTRRQITPENAELEETTDTGQPVDILGSGSLKLFTQQPTSNRNRRDRSAKRRNGRMQERKNHELSIPLSEETLPANNGGANARNGTALVQGYGVKTTAAPILTAIFAKYGDIAASCKHKSRTKRACLLESVCHVVQQLQNIGTPLNLSEIKVFRNEMINLEDMNLKLSWLTGPFENISELERIEGLRSALMSVRGNCMLFIKTATKELEKALKELVELQKGMGENEKRINAIKLVVEQVDDIIKDGEEEELRWLRQINALP